MTRQQFTASVESSQQAFRRFLVALCCGDAALADDTAQEAYIKAYVGLDSLRDGSRFESWLYRIGYNTFVSQRRSLRPMAEYTEALAVDGGVDADAAFRYESLYRALNMLPHKERTSVLLFYMENYSVKDIAEFEGTSEGAVRQHLSRGRRHLQNLLK